MDVNMEVIRIAMYQILDNVYPDLTILSEYGHYTADDIIDQSIMEYIIKEYQAYAERKSIRRHRYENGMTSDLDDAATAQRYNRLIEKAEHYKQIKRNQLWESAGVQRIDLSKNEMYGPSNWQNAYSLTDTEFHELTMQDECRLLKKIFEHKISSKNSVPNPMFKEMFSEYEAQLNELYASMDLQSPDSIIAKTSELFSLQWIYNIELFYRVTLEAEKHNFPQEIPYKRIAALCAHVPIIPATDWSPLEIHGAENRMLQKRELYCEDIFTMPDEEWAFQMDIIGEACRLKEILSQAKGGTAFIPYFHQVPSSEKAKFIRDRYWLWDKRQHFDLSNRKRIQYMRNLYENLTVEMTKPQSKKS